MLMPESSCSQNKVALLTEGVDRNFEVSEKEHKASTSPSSRRAWIEIIEQQVADCEIFVALLAEGVDRNFKDRYFPTGAGESPSSRRAWIEINEL